MTKIKTFINKYNWKGINYTSERDDSEKIEKNNLMVALNVLHAKKKIYIYPPDASKHNSNHKKQVTTLLIQKRKGWYYLAIKKTISIINVNGFKT